MITLRWHACGVSTALAVIVLLGLPNMSYAENAERVQITDAFIELHTGPGDGYPVLKVGKRGEAIEILLRKSDWFKVRTATGDEGWVFRAQMEQTLTATGATTKFRDIGVSDYTERRWETGAFVGEFSGATVLSAFGAYGFTSKMFAEASVSHVLGDYSSDTLLGVSLLGRPFPAWRVAPYLRLGAGMIRIMPKATLAETPDRTDNYAQVGLGIQTYLTRRYALRMEYNNYAIFSGRDETEGSDEWKLGISVFF